MLLPSLAGCPAHSTRSVADRPDLAAIPQSLKLPCRSVVDIPDKALSERETADLWARDRTSLGDCRARHGALVTAVGAIERQGR